MRIQTIRVTIFVAILMAPGLAAQEVSKAPSEALIARAKALELQTPYVPPPGDPLEHHTAGFAKIMCSAVFITGLDPDFAAENVGYFTSPYAERAKVGKPVIDRANKAVHITLPNGVKRTARYLGDQGCVTLPTGKQSLNFTPVRIPRKLPDAAKQALAYGRRAAEGLALWNRYRQAKTGCGRGVRAGIVSHSGSCGDLERTPHRRALRCWDHAAN